MDPALEELLAEGQPEDEVAVVLRLDGHLPPPAGARIIARFGPIATCRLQRGAIPVVRAAPGVLSMKAPRRYLSEPDAEGMADDSAEAEDVLLRDSDLRRPKDLPETGLGVLVAHIDWGADIAHPDFRHADGRTRFAALWDQGAEADPERLNRYGYGRIHSADDINHALQTDDPYATLGYHPARGKPAGGSHGSHTLGIAAGNGRAGGPAGLAPEATLVFVDLSTLHQLPSAGLGDSAALLEGLDFIAQVAAALGPQGQPLPLVVNASLGRQAGQHDGRTLTEQGMDAFLLQTPGRAIVQSTGNYFGRRIHASGLLSPGAEAVLDFRIPNHHPPHELDLWYPAPDRFSVRVCGPAGMAPVLAIPGQMSLLLHEGQPVGRVYHRRSDPNNGDHQVALYLDALAPPGAWVLRLHADDVVDGRFHAWIERGPGGGAAQAAFATDDDSPCCTLGTICNGLRTLAVGAVDAHDPEHPLAPFSSGGPTRDGRAKPDLLAPGLRVLSARSAGADGALRPLLMRMSGTSMAAPHVCGTVALMFAAAPQPLAISETRRLLLACASPATPTADPVARWRQGAGHLDTRAAVDAARSVAAAQPTAHPIAHLIETPLFNPATPLPWSIPMPSSAPEQAETLQASEAIAGAEAASLQPCGCSGIRRDEATADEQLAEAERLVRDPRNSWGWQRPNLGLSPLQFQIPIAGGAPSLALPIGGAGSPFAFSVPLGGPPAASPAPALAPAPAAPAASLPPTAPSVPTTPPSPAGVPLPAVTPPSDAPVLPALAAVPATDFEAPVLVAGHVSFPAAQPEAVEAAPPWDFDPAPVPAPHPGLAVLAAALKGCNDAADCTPRSSGQWLRRLLQPASEGGDKRVFSLRGDDGAAPTATALFNAFVYPEAQALRRHLQARYRQYLQPLARPGERIDGMRVLPGDLLLRVALGQGHGHAAVVASPLMCRHDELPAWAFRVPGSRPPREGHYLHVVEMLPQVRGAGERWARRVADGRGRLLPDTLLLRRHVPIDERTPHTENHLEALSEDATADIRWLQTALNQVLGTHLAVDGDAGPATRTALRQFQGLRGLATDGIASQRTLAALHGAVQHPGSSAAAAAGNASAAGAAGAVAGTGGATGDCATLSSFLQGEHSVSVANLALLRVVAQHILRDGIRSVVITGFASSEGVDIDNIALGMRRANEVGAKLRLALESEHRGSSAGVALLPFSRGESEQIAGGNRPLNRRVTVCLQQPAPLPALAAARTQEFRLVAKSFIAHIGSNVGTLDCELDSTVSTIAKVVSPVGGLVLDWLAPHASNLGLDGIALGVDQAFNEDPVDDHPFTAPPPEGKGYRMFSRGRVSAQFRGSQLLALTLTGAIDTDSGKECVPHTGSYGCLQAPPLIIDQPFVTRRIDASRVAFRWGVKGRPPRPIVVSMQAVCMRDPMYIWHQIDGVVDCSSGSPQITQVAFTGSRFPSHRLWLDGRRLRDIPQGPLSKVWDSAAGDSTRVR